MVDLGTTNLLLGILAAVSVLEALVLIGAGVMGYRIYRQVMTLVEQLEEKHVAPVMQKVNGIVGDVQGITAQVRAETERVDRAIHGAIDRVDETADRVKSRVSDRAKGLVAAIRSVRDVIESALSGRGRRSTATHSPGQP